MLELLEGDISSWRRLVEIQTMEVLRLLISDFGELLFTMVDIMAPFGVDSAAILPEHHWQLVDYTNRMVTYVTAIVSL